MGVILDIESGTITEHVKFDSGNLCTITGGHNLGRVGVIHPAIVTQDPSISSTSRMLPELLLLPDFPTFSLLDVVNRLSFPFPDRRESKFPSLRSARRDSAANFFTS